MDPIDVTNPEDLKNPLVADLIRRELPERLINVNGHPAAAAQGEAQGPKVLTREQIVEEVLGRLRNGLLKDSSSTPAALEEAIDLALLQAGLDRETVRPSLPYNATQVYLGAFSMLRACGTLPAAAVLKVEVQTLAQYMAAVQRARPLRAVLERAFLIADANEVQGLSQAATVVDRGLEVGWSTIQNNAELLRALQPALDIRDKPAEAASLSRASNERRDEATRKAVETQLQGQAQPEARPQVTATVSTAPTPPLAPAPRVTPGKK